jgi:hypothetical protein
MCCRMSGSLSNPPSLLPVVSFNNPLVISLDIAEISPRGKIDCY